MGNLVHKDYHNQVVAQLNGCVEDLKAERDRLTAAAETCSLEWAAEVERLEAENKALREEMERLKTSTEETTLLGEVYVRGDVHQKERQRAEAAETEYEKAVGMLREESLAVAKLCKKLTAAEASLHRWQTGDLVEGDYITRDGDVVGDPYVRAERAEARLAELEGASYRLSKLVAEIACIAEVDVPDGWGVIWEEANILTHRTALTPTGDR